MAVAFQSVQTAGPIGRDDGQKISITKPTSTADGDLLIAHFGIMVRNYSIGFKMSTLSGWTEINYTQNGKQSSHVFYKVAGASEPSTYDWGFDDGTSNVDGAVTGAIYRITGQGSVGSIQSSFKAGFSPWDVTLTPTFADSLILMLVTANDGSADKTGSVSGYAIATDNPTWTERYDVNGNMDTHFGGGDPSQTLIAGATASRTEQTATGDASATIAGYNGEVIAGLVIIPPVVNVTVSGTTGIVELVGNDGSVSGVSNTAGTTGIIELVGNDGVVTTPAQKWSNVDKSSAPSWNNLDKS